MKKIHRRNPKNSPLRPKEIQHSWTREDVEDERVHHSRTRHREITIYHAENLNNENPGDFIARRDEERGTR